MPIPILMPALSPTMTEGKLAAWLKNEGDPVAPGDVIAEIETDKATMEVEAVEEGVLGRILVAAGTEGVAINTTIALLLEEGEGPESLDAPAVAAPAAPAPVEAPPTPAEPTPAATPGAKPGNGRILASPLARRMAKQAGIDLAALRGSGPGGRIVKADIEAAIAAAAARPPSPAPVPAAAVPAPAAPMPAPMPAPAPAEPAAVPGMPAFREVANSTMRKVIARRLTESKQQAPHFYLSMDCEIDALLALRKELNAKSAQRITVNDLVIKAAGLALKKVPAANASWTEAGIRLYSQADVSVAVAIEGGLITPVVRAAERKGLAEIAAEMADLAARARDGKLKPEDYQGGTFSISNLGMYGVRDFYAVINPPQGAILAIGAGDQRPVVKDGALAIATVMTCSLSCDHRAVDGAVGAAFLAAFKALIEDPLTMLL